MHVNVSGLLRNFARVRRAALAGETVVIATPDGNLVLAAHPQVGDPLRGTPQGTVRSDVDLDAVMPTREGAVRGDAPTGAPRPAPNRRFVSRAAIAHAARSAPRIDAERLRADIDTLIDPNGDG